MPRSWTQEQRAEFGQKMKEKREAKKEANANPIADSGVIPDPEPETQIKHVIPPPRPVVPPPYDTKKFLDEIANLPLESISYVDCGLLLNALSAASTAIATARRLKQESLDAGTHRAPCATCGRSIDISKSGGFQILTVRDEHWQPKNVYFCSQNCLLAQNMPSRKKQQKEATA